MENITVHIEASLEYDVEIEISDANYRKYENGEIDDEELLEIYEDKINDAAIEADRDAADFCITNTSL